MLHTPRLGSANRRGSGSGTVVATLLLLLLLLLLVASPASNERETLQRQDDDSHAVKGKLQRASRDAARSEGTQRRAQRGGYTDRQRCPWIDRACAFLEHRRARRSDGSERAEVQRCGLERCGPNRCPGKAWDEDLRCTPADE